MIAFCKSRVPAVGVYFVLPSVIASAAASLMFCGVSKSGSPAPRSTTSTPAARIASAACIAASVEDAFICVTFSDTGNMEVTLAAIGSYFSRLFFLSHAFFDQWRHQSVNRRAQVEYFLHQ